MSRISRLIIATSLCVLPWLGPTSLQAQFVNRAAARWYAGAAVWNTGFNYGWGYGATTPAESYYRGMADVIRARGQFAESQARAARDLEIARQQAMENQSQRIEEYQRRRRVGLAEQAARQQEQRAAIDRARAARGSQSPDLPVAAEVDPDTGVLSWPEVLQGPEYQAARDQLDDLFLQRASAGNTPEIATQIAAAVQDMRSVLGSRIREYPANDFIAADQFLRRLSTAGAVAS